MVEVDVLPDDGNGGVKRGPSVVTLLKDPIVEDLPRLPSLPGGPSAVDDLVDSPDAVESLRDSGIPGTAKLMDDAASATCEGDGRGDGSPSSPCPAWKGR